MDGWLRLVSVRACIYTVPKVSWMYKYVVHTCHSVYPESHPDLFDTPTVGMRGMNQIGLIGGRLHMSACIRMMYVPIRMPVLTYEDLLDIRLA